MGFRLHNCSFHGKVVKTMELAGLRLTEIRYDPNLRNPRHSHEDAYIGITLDGNSTQLCEDKVRSSKPWTVMYHPAGEIHSDQFHEGGARELNIEIAPSRLEGLRQRSLFADCPMDLNGGKAGWVAARLYREFRLMDELSGVAIEGLTIELMAEILRQNLKGPRFRPPAWLRQANELIHDRFAERLTLSTIAETVGVHPVHLAREFHRCMGCTVGQRLRQLRVEYACRLLSQNDDPLAEIALAVGFSDQSQFSKTFQTLTGMTPSQYRRQKNSR
jgi:AraC family transcriptional regulator